MADDDQLSELEQEFVASWDWMERFYNSIIIEDHWEWVRPILGLISELRKRGYERQFRAGQQLLAFILSRSRKHGLRHGQPSFGIEPNPNGGATVWYREPPDVWMQFQIDRIEITPAVEDLLNRLLSYPID